MPAFITPADVKFFQDKNKEFYSLFFFPVKVYKVRQDSFNPTYGEDSNKKFELPYEIEAYMPDLPEWKNKMTKFGMDETRELIIYFSIDLLKERGVEFPSIGDQLTIQDDTYLITQTNPQQFGSNLQIPLSHICHIKRIHYENPEAGSAVEKNF